MAGPDGLGDHASRSDLSRQAWGDAHTCDELRSVRVWSRMGKIHAIFCGLGFHCGEKRWIEKNAGLARKWLAGT